MSFMSVRCGRLQMIPPLGGGEKEPESLISAMQQILGIFLQTNKLQFLNSAVRKANPKPESTDALGLPSITIRQIHRWHAGLIARIAAEKCNKRVPAALASQTGCITGLLQYQTVPAV